MSTETQFAAILAYFTSIGMPLEHFPGEGEGRDMWQYDGIDNPGGWVVQIVRGINGNNDPSVFGDLDGGLGKCFSISGSIKNWMVDMPEWVEEALKS